MNTFVRLICAVYAHLRRPYPPRFRDEFGAEMQAVFRQTAEEAASRGWAELARLCWRELRDWPAALLLAHQLDHAQKGRLAMVSSMVTGRDRPRWFFYLGWVVASMAGMYVAWKLTWAIMAQITKMVGDRIIVAGQSHITEDFLGAWILFPAVGVLTGSLQYLMLRRHLPRIGWWIAATALGWVLPLLIIGPLFAGLGRLVSSASGLSGDVTTALSAALLGGSMGLPQWLVLWRQVPHAGWWLDISVLGGLVTVLVTGRTIDTSADLVAVAAIPAIGASLALWLLLDRRPPRPAETARA